jgi:hypothetical protein
MRFIAARRSSEKGNGNKKASNQYRCAVPGNGGSARWPTSGSMKIKEEKLVMWIIESLLGAPIVLMFVIGMVLDLKPELVGWITTIWFFGMLFFVLPITLHFMPIWFWTRIDNKWKKIVAKLFTRQGVGDDVVLRLMIKRKRALSRDDQPGRTEPELCGTVLETMWSQLTPAGREIARQMARDNPGMTDMEAIAKVKAMGE